MTTAIELTVEELEELHQLLKKELERTLVELRRTDTRVFKQRVREHIEILENILAAVEKKEQTPAIPT